MFSVVYHPEAREEATALPVKIRVKFDRLIGKLEYDDYCGSRTRSPWAMDFLRSARWGRT
jgi:mRNA-degrading endonuclease RelE of RelBE toxin-antitoxin system